MFSIIQQVRNLRVQKRLSQTQLAERIDWKQSQISRLEQHKSDIRLSSLIELSRALDSEIMLVPNNKIAMVKALIDDAPARPRWRPDDELDEDFGGMG